MKTKILFIVTAIIMTMTFEANAQAPEKLNYQGIARDSNGDALANQALGVKISILHNSTVDYSETHSVTTNGFGLYTLIIGDGTPIFGGMASVDWSSGNKFVKVEIDPNGGTNYSDLGTTELLSVPYALYAAESPSAGGPPTGAAGGDLTGNYPNPNISNNAVTTGKIAANAVESSDIKDGEVNTADLANSAVTAPKIDAMGATNGQVLKYDGTNWSPANDSGASYTAGTGIAISGTNEITADLGTDIATAEIQDNAVTSAKIDNYSIQGVDIVDNTIDGTKIFPMGAAPGEVLEWNGADWAPATDDSGTTYSAGTGIAISGTNEITADLGTDIATAEIQNNAVTSGKIDNGTIATADLANNSVTGAKIAGMGATNGQVLTYDGTDWAPTSPSAGSAGWELSGNAASATDFIGTTNAEALRFKQNNLSAGFINGDLTAFGQNSLSSNTTGGGNTALGESALASNTTGDNNTAIGETALSFNVDGSENTALGEAALYSNTSGDDNTAIGSDALSFNTTGFSNTAVGKGALSPNTSGNNNTAVGTLSLFSNSTGNFNTAIGTRALQSNTIAGGNSALGYKALWKNTTGSANTAIGSQGLTDNTTGERNTALGSSALYKNITGNDNTAVGVSALHFNTTGFENTAIGEDALRSNSTGEKNTAIGQHAMYSNTTGNHNTALGQASLTTNTTGNDNTAIGQSALQDNTIGNFNTAMGVFALSSNIDGIKNTAIGERAMKDNTSGNGNTAVGDRSMYSNTTGDENTAVGQDAMFFNTTGTSNTAIGAKTLRDNTTGSDNTAIGQNTLTFNTTGVDNTAAGANTLSANTTGIENSAFGEEVLSTNTTGGKNSAFGSRALYYSTTGDYNSAFGYSAMSGNGTGNYNSAFGHSALTSNDTGNNNSAFGNNADVSTGNLTNATAIGAQAYVAQSNSMVLGSINGVNGATADTNVGIGTTTPDYLLHVNGNAKVGNTLYIGSGEYFQDAGTFSIKVNAGLASTYDGIDDLGTATNRWQDVYATNGTIQTSDRRSKTAIEDLDYGLEEVMALHPVKFKWKEKEEQGYKLGVIAQEIQKVLPEVVKAHDFKRTEEGTIEKVELERLGVYYSDIIPVLIKSIQEQQQIIDTQQKSIEKLKERLDQLEGK